MGLYSRVIGEAKCPYCETPSTFSIQFKYGALLLRDYLLGETLIWGGMNEMGRADARYALVPGISERPCSVCYSSDEDCNSLEFVLLIQENKLKAIFPFNDLFKDGFFILD